MASSAWRIRCLVGLLTLLQLFVLGAHGWCMVARPKIEIKDGQTHTYCEYEGVRHEVGSTFRIPSQCLECTCDKSAMGCCGYGIAAGVYSPVKGCKIISRDCTPYMVKEEDETKDCETGGPIKPVGKK